MTKVTPIQSDVEHFAKDAIFGGMHRITLAMPLRHARQNLPK
ncbi:hypothetical protein ACTJJ7_16520 [Phyllobacterium sp. 22229]